MCLSTIQARLTRLRLQNGNLRCYISADIDLIFRNAPSNHSTMTRWRKETF